MQNKIITCILIFSVVLSSCNSKEKQEKQADERLKHIEQLISENNYGTAKLEIDSIHILFPRLVSKRKIAVAYRDTIIRRESSRTLAYSDSILPIKQHEFDSIQRDFRFEKNDKYQEFGNYVYKSQITEQNASRNYLKCYVDENADLYLISNVSGSRIEHNAVQLTANEISIQTDTTNTSKANFHNFSDAGMYWESLTFKNEAESGLTTFIFENQKEKIKVNLSGKKKISYYLSEQDKKAIAATYRFWILKKDLKQLQKEIEKATIKIGNIKLRYQN